MPAATQPFIPANAIADIADFIGDPVSSAQFPDLRLRWRNDRAAAQVGLAPLDDAAWLDHFGRFQPLAGSLPQPLALRYHGHQFRYYNPDIGDGRGFLFAQVRDHRGRLMDLGTKGSGQTPYSRSGDGRLTLKGGMREILATEMLEALGVETSRTFSLIETGEALHRGDEPSPTRGAVMVRLSHGHIRIGSFQRLAALGLTDALDQLARYCLKYYFDDDGEIDAPVRLLAHVVSQTARLAASYRAAGFVHGVLNSDNINVTGESFDYGPWRFAPTFDDAFTAAYFDSAGLYRFGQQAEAIHWNVVQLAIALSSITDPALLEDALEGFGAEYRAHLAERFMWRLGVRATGGEKDALALAQVFESTLRQSNIGIDQFFFDWAGGKPRRGGYADPVFDALRGALNGFVCTLDLTMDYWNAARPCSLLIDEVEALWLPIAEGDDWNLFNAKITNIRQIGEALANPNPAT